MKDSAEVPGLEELGINDTENHPLALFIMAQTLYTGNNQDGFKNALQQFMQSIQTNTMALATGQLNPQNIDAFMNKLEMLGEGDVQRFRERLNPSLKTTLKEVEEIIEIEEEQITIVVKEEVEEQAEDKPEVVVIVDSEADKKDEQEDAKDGAAKDEDVKVEQPEKAEETDAKEEDGPIITIVEQPEQTAEADEGQDNISEGY